MFEHKGTPRDDRFFSPRSLASNRSSSDEWITPRHVGQGLDSSRTDGGKSDEWVTPRDGRDRAGSNQSGRSLGDFNPYDTSPRPYISNEAQAKKTQHERNIEIATDALRRGAVRRPSIDYKQDKGYSRIPSGAHQLSHGAPLSNGIAYPSSAHDLYDFGVTPGIDLNAQIGRESSGELSHRSSRGNTGRTDASARYGLTEEGPLSGRARESGGIEIDMDALNVNENDVDEAIAAGMLNGVSPEDVEDIFSLARHNRADDIERLLDRGIPINVRDKFGNTVLTIASQNGNKRVAKVVLRRGADINARNLKGNTPLHYCYHYGYGDSLGQYLISKGADINARSNSGKLPQAGI